MAGSVFLVLIGNVLRAFRTKSLLDLAKHGKFGPQFRTLSLGYFFNLVLPLRAGELIRAYLLSRQLRISALFSLAVVLLDRLLDAALVAGVILVASQFTDIAPGGLALPAGLVLGGTALTLVVFALLVRQHGALMHIVWRGSSAFSPSLERRLRMEVWAVVNGFQQFFFSPRRVMRYLGLFGLSWAAYLGALGLLLTQVAPSFADHLPLNAVAPFLGPDAVFSLSSLPAYVDSLVGLFANTVPTATVAQSQQVAGLMWVVLNVPVALIGMVALFDRRLVARAEPDPQTGAANSLARSADRGDELKVFLDSFFRRDELAQALHELDVKGEIDLIRFYAGGSDAVTALIRTPAGTRVRKTVPIAFRDRLQTQYEWLQRHRNVPSIVRALGERTREDHYEIDLAYDPLSTSFFAYAHTHSLDDCCNVLRRVWEELYSSVYTLGDLGSFPELRDSYIQERLVARVELAAKEHDDLASALDSTAIRVNGSTYLNFHSVLAAITADQRCMADLACFRPSSATHGDLTVSNLLVTASGTPLIIDPSDDNQIRGPILDFARLLQSLWGGYEFLISDERPPVFTRADDTAPPEIAYLSLRSARYQELTAWLQDFAVENLSEEERRALPFHVGLFFGRVLTHRTIIDPYTVLTYFAKCVEFLNLYYRQYETPRSPK